MSALQAEVRAQRRKEERAKRKRLYRILVGAGGPWERAYNIWKWATLASIGAGYVARKFVRHDRPWEVTIAAVAVFFASALTVVVAVSYLAPGKASKK